MSGSGANEIASSWAMMSFALTSHLSSMSFQLPK